MNIFFQAGLLVAHLHYAASFSTSDLMLSPRQKNEKYLSMASFAVEAQPSLFSYTHVPINSRSRNNNCVLYSNKDTDGAESTPSMWHHLPRNVLLGNDRNKNADSIMHGCDAVVIPINTNDNDSINPGSVWARAFHDQSTSKITEIMATQQNLPPEGDLKVPKEAIEAIQATHRWSSNFVRKLHLCPWAGSSLDTPGAIRYWILLVDDDDDDESGNSSVVLEKVEDAVREAGRHLEQITSPASLVEGVEGMVQIDPAVAISFVILVDQNAISPSLSSTQASNLPDFGAFHDFFLDLEDRLLDECDEYWDGIDDEEAEEEEEGDDGDDDEHAIDGPLGCQITIAAFHPQWKFEGGIINAEQPIDFEKRTPYPTISCVMSTAIDALMSENANNDDVDGVDDGSAASAPVTGRIAALNEKILEGVGVDGLRDLFEDEVMKCPYSHDE